MNRPRYEVRSEDIYGREFMLRQTSDNRLVTNKNGDVLLGAPLDRESIVKRMFGKMAYGTQISIGIEQLLHPQIGAAVEHTGKFWKNPYDRVAVSIDPIMSVVYADDPYAAGSMVRRFHQGITGTDQNGESFNALNPDPFYWAHETFRRGVQNWAENYNPEGLTDAGREQLQLENVTWYSYYGMPMDYVPKDYQANVEYRKNMVDNVLRLEKNPSAERAIDLALNRTPPRPEMVPKMAWPLAKIALAPVTEIMSVLTIGELPKDIRDKFGIPFSKDEQKFLDDIRTVIGTLENPLPRPVQYPTVYKAIKRDEGGEHKNAVDHMAHLWISLGSTALARTLKTARAARSLLPV